jgi:RND family efflux transporter MFP subunit
MIRKIFIIVGLATILFGADKGPSLVNTAKVTKEIVNPLEKFIGTLSFSRSSDLASATNGSVTNVNFQAGDRVKKGDVLVQVDSDILNATIASAKASVDIAKITLENAKKDFNRYKELIEKKSISQKIYDDSFTSFVSAKANLAKAKAVLQELTVQKEKKMIKAPFDGAIVAKNVELGEWVNNGKVVATLVDTSNIDLIFNLPSSYVYKLNREREYDIELKDKTISSKLYAAIPKGDIRTRTFPVKFKANLEDLFVFDGMEVKVSLPRDLKQESLVVPRDAVIKRFGQDVIFIDNDGKAMMLPVKVVGYNKTSVAVEAQGLVEGANVVVKGNERIFPDQPIKIINK